MQVFKQTKRLFQFSLKKEWLKLLCWLIGISYFVFIGAGAFIALYSESSERAAMLKQCQIQRWKPYLVKRLD